MRIKTHRSCCYLYFFKSIVKLNQMEKPERDLEVGLIYEVGSEHYEFHNFTFHMNFTHVKSAH